MTNGSRRPPPTGCHPWACTGRNGFTLIELLVVMAIIAVLAGLLLDHGQAGVAIVAGWCFHLRRLALESTLDVPGTLTALTAFALLVAGIHGFARGWQNLKRVQAPDRPAPRPWQWRWSFSITLGIVMLAAAGIAALGFAHQTAWLASGPPMFSGREAMPRFQTYNQLKQMALGAHIHHDQHKHFPPGGTFDADGRALHGWETSLLPYLEQEALYKQIRLDLPWRHPANRAALATELAMFRSPYLISALADGWGLTHYAGNLHVLGGQPLVLPDIVDGTSNTILFGEAAAEFTPWGRPFNVRDPGLGINLAPGGFGNPSSSTQGASFAMADGSVRFLGDKVSPSVLKALATPAGGEAIPADDDW